MTPWALENIALYNQYGSVDAALAAGKSSILGQADAGLLHPAGGTGATLGLIIAIFIAHVALIIVRWRNWRCRQASSRLTSRFCLVCRSS
jgi:PTS system cellobiose-specific IIC component